MIGDFDPRNLLGLTTTVGSALSDAERDQICDFAYHPAAGTKAVELIDTLTEENRVLKSALERIVSAQLAVGVSVQTFQDDGAHWIRLAERRIRADAMPNAPPHLVKSIAWSGATPIEAANRARVFLSCAQIELGAHLFKLAYESEAKS